MAEPTVFISTPSFDPDDILVDLAGNVVTASGNVVIKDPI